MRRALLGGCLVLAICGATVLGQQPDDFGRKGGKGPGKGGKLSKMMSTPSAEAPPIQRWEYAVRMEHELMEIGGYDLQRGLDRMGDVGWELVSAATNIFYFKRPKHSPPPPPPPHNEPRQEGPPAPPMPPGNFGRVDRPQINPAAPSKQTTTFIQLKNSEANSVAQILSGVFQTGGRFIPETRSNRLILIVPEEKLADIRKFIEELDQPFKSNAPRAK